MKRKLILLFLTISIISVACGRTETTIEKESQADSDTIVQESFSEESSTEVSSTSAISVDENLLSVEITISKDFLGTEVTQESLDQSLAENGFDSATLNDDGSVTYKMSKKKHKEFLDELKKSLEETCNNLINGEDAVESFERITFNDDMTKFDVYVDKASFSDWDSFSTLGFYMYGSYYQAFSGVKGEDIDVEVNYIDKDTDEIITSSKLSDSPSSTSDESEISVEDKLFEIENWYTGDIWNNFVDFDSYRLTGKDCTGSEIDIEFAYKNFKKSYAKKDEYDSYISSLSDEYADLKEAWEKMNEQIELIYADLEANGISEGGDRLSLSLLQQYADAFDDYIY